jgi:hypothetical protein
MGAHLAELTPAFKVLGSAPTTLLTGKNKQGTLDLLTGAARTPPEQRGSRLVRRFQEGSDAMIAAFGTLAFLATLWLLVVVGAAVLEESGAKIAAALKGRAVQRPSLVPTRLRTRQRLQRPMRVPAVWRAAA